MPGPNYNDTDKQPLTATTLTDAVVTGKVLTGFVSAPGVVGSGDSILSAINKLDGNIVTGTGSIVTTSTLGADKTISSADPNYEDVGLSVTFTTIANETVQLECSGEASSLVTTSYLVVAYQLDATAEVAVYNLGGHSTDSQNISFVIPVLCVAAGSHTIKLRAMRYLQNWKIYGTAAYGSAKLSVIQYRAIATTGAVVSDWTSFTPTGSWTTNVTYTGFYKRVGDSLDVRIRILFSGAPDAGNLTVNMPAGFTIDTAKMLDTTAQDALVGECYLLDTGIQRYGLGHVGYYSSTSLFPFYPIVVGALVTQAAITKTAPFTLGNGDKIFINFSVPIV